MKYRLISTFIYGIATFCFWLFFDALYGAGPVTRDLALIYLAIGGSILYAIACVSSLFSLRFAVISGLAGALLVWPYFAIEVREIPWSKLWSALPYANWRYELAALFFLVVSSCYLAVQLRLMFRASPR
jgi:hypothetical protein